MKVNYTLNCVKMSHILVNVFTKNFFIYRFRCNLYKSRYNRSISRFFSFAQYYRVKGKIFMNKQIDIYEVGPRDGFQNLKTYIPLEKKLKIIDDLIASGVKHLQITSFVSPKAIPQLKDAAEVARLCLEKYKNVDFFALVPNLRGAQTAWEVGIRKISYVVSLSESHNRANINRTHEESYEELRKIMEKFPEMHVCIDLATAFGCPFEGKVPAETVVGFMKDYVALGVHEFNLCDTIGIANPKQVRTVIHVVRAAYPDLILQVHIHDTRNMGMVNTLAAIEAGVERIQSTLGGLGGCPFAPGASGNLATEDIVYMLNDMGYYTGIDFDELLEASKREKEVIADGVFSGHHMNIQKRAEE